MTANKKIVSYLDKASNLFFFMGAVLSKFQYIPFVLTSALCRFISLGAYLFAYSIWFIATTLRQDHQAEQKNWPALIQIKGPVLLSSCIGLIATILSVIAIFIPIFLLPAAWLFLIANGLYTMSEYNKLNNPPKNEADFSAEKQTSILSYAKTITSMSLITALATTLTFVFPPIAIPIALVSLFISACLGILALEHWFNAYFKNHQPSMPINTASFLTINEHLGVSEHPDAPEPTHSHGIVLQQSNPSRGRSNRIYPQPKDPELQPKEPISLAYTT